jgi:hypothetical protein
VVVTACSAPRPLPTAAPLPSASASASTLAAPEATPASSSAPEAKPEPRLSLEELPPELPEFDGKPVALPAAPAGVAREPPSCRALLSPAPRPQRACAQRDDAVQLLAEALAGSAAEQKRALHALERCEGFPPGFVRAVRAELERECAETLAAPLLHRPPAGISAELVQTLHGLALASRFVRAVAPAPVMPEPVDPDRIDAFVAGPLTRYREVTEARLERVALALRTLPEQSHGHAVALAGQAVAWQRIRRLRGQTLPDTLKKTYTLRVQYFERIDALGAGLEQKALLFTREATASASLHGLLGDRALQLHLAEIHSASKLHWLQLPRSSSELHSTSPWYRLASRLPARYAAELLSQPELTDENTLAELAPGGLSLRQKRALSRAPTERDLRILAELHLKLGLVLGRDQELREASRLVELVEQPTGSDLLLQAATRDLLRAPDHLQTPTAVPAEFVPSALLALADDLRKPEEIRTIAGYDAAVLMSASRQLPTLHTVLRRLQTVQHTVSDPVTRDCAGALQYAISDVLRFESNPPHCNRWPWLNN